MGMFRSIWPEDWTGGVTQECADCGERVHGLKEMAEHKCKEQADANRTEAESAETGDTAGNTDA
jgi:hypothetical protein